MRPLFTWAVIAMCCLLCGCGALSGRQSLRDDPVVNIAEDDASMNQAIATARARVGEFIPLLQKPGPDHSDFSVKVPIHDGDKTEHMWLTPVRFDGTKFVGAINNDPEGVHTVKLGQEISVPKAEISDWMYVEMYVEKGHLKGGFTLRVLRDKMGAKERQEFDREFPFIID
jgi:uncharacterized protein YegJ (DUF2314 family)